MSVYTVETMSGETDLTPFYSLQEALEFLQDVEETNDGKIFDAHTEQLVANVVNGNIVMV